MDSNLIQNMDSDKTALARVQLDITRFTPAPLRMAGTFTFDCAPETLWPMVTEASGIASWLPIISGGSHDNSTSNHPGSCGIGAKRYCQTVGMGVLDETILHYDAPRVCVYNVKNGMMPIQDHAAVMVLEASMEGGTLFTWHQYYRDKGLIMKWMFPHMMTMFINMGMRKLAERFGGSGGRMRII